MTLKFNKILQFCILILFFISIISLVQVSSLKKDVSFEGNCSRSFSLAFSEKCECINDCGISLVCRQFNKSRKCVNVLSDYLNENNLTKIED